MSSFSTYVMSGIKQIPINNAKNTGGGYELMKLDTLPKRSKCDATEDLLLWNCQSDGTREYSTGTEKSYDLAEQILQPKDSICETAQDGTLSCKSIDTSI